MKNTDWKTEMDAVVQRSTANWTSTGIRNCQPGLTGSVNLASSERVTTRHPRWQVSLSPEITAQGKK